MSEKCIVCKREKTFPTEGRYINGDWDDDKHIAKKYWGKWICSYKCYDELVKQSTNKEE